MVNKNFYEKDNYYNEELFLEYEKDIVDYINKYKPTQYNEILAKDKRTKIHEIFSPSRTNIVKWLDSDKNKEVLQIGANYAEVTKELVEKYKTVTIVEFSEIKINAILKRLENKNNYDCILATNLSKVKFEKKYDYIFIIGTAEYAKKLGFKNLEGMIKWAFEFIKDEGKVYIAIDNKFGVKYLAGSTRNSLEIPFSNYKPEIEKSYELYGKNELIEIFEKNNFKHKFYYPVPNYALTHLIYTDEYLPKQSQYNIYYNEHEEILFNEINLLQEAKKNKVFDIFTNSFFIELTKKSEFSNVKYVNFSNMRKKEYKIFTKIIDSKVEKEAYSNLSKKHILKINENLNKMLELNLNFCEKYENEKIISIFQNSNTLDKYINDLLEKEKYEEAIIELDKWYIFLKEKLKISKEKCTIFEKYNIKISEEEINQLTILENGFIDMIFQNVFYDNEKYIIIDQEWYEKNVPLEFIMYRGLNQLKFQYSAITNKINFDDLYSKYNIKKYINYFDELETKWQEEILDKEIFSFYQEKWKRLIGMNDIKNNHNKELENLNNELALIKNRKLYKIMKFLDKGSQKIWKK